MIQFYPQNPYMTYLKEMNKIYEGLFADLNKRLDLLEVNVDSICKNLEYTYDKVEKLEKRRKKSGRI